MPLVGPSTPSFRGREAEPGIQKNQPRRKNRLDSGFSRGEPRNDEEMPLLDLEVIPKRQEQQKDKNGAQHLLSHGDPHNIHGNDPVCSVNFLHRIPVGGFQGPEKGNGMSDGETDNGVMVAVVIHAATKPAVSGEVKGTPGKERSFYAFTAV